MEKSRNTNSDTYGELKVIREYNTKIVRQTIEDNSNMKVLRRKLSASKQKVNKMKNQQGILITD